jgi:uncharacterized protein YndB with AHSA1/START domain
MTDDTTLRLVRVFNADRRRVFRAFTDPAQLRQWFCPDGFAFLEVRVDAASGLATDFVMANQQTGERYAWTLEYEQVDEPNRIRWHSIWRDGFPEIGYRTQVTLAFRDVAAGTEVTLTHETFPSSQARDAHGEGWTSSLERLGRMVGDSRAPVAVA